jgi:hypothetical protein
MDLQRGIEMLEALTPEELEAWKKRRKGVDTSLHVLLEAAVPVDPLPKADNAKHLKHVSLFKLHLPRHHAPAV